MTATVLLGTAVALLLILHPFGYRRPCQRAAFALSLAATLFGLVVLLSYTTGTVSEVLDISSENIEPPPSMGESVDSSFILGMGKVGDAVKILLAIQRVLAAEELASICQTATHEPPPRPEPAEKKTL